ncbi:MAG: hypothetical protein CMH58_07845 [Myxococcales bacterium]|nr:hypothetical protein [Myxococcales bacterium]
MPKQICSEPECKRKVSKVEEMMGKCRCNKVFCILHRMPETHKCEFVFIIDKDKFIKENKCVAAKI